MIRRRNAGPAPARTGRAAGPGDGGAGRFGLAVVEGRSMLPTLRPGDRLLVRWGAAGRPGRLVVVRLPDGVVAVKRAFRRDGAGWWVERDNPAEGVDSWQVGSIPDADVLGLVLARLWPPRLAQPAARRRAR